MKKIVLSGLLVTSMFAGEIESLTKGCNGGDAKQCFNLGIMYDDGTEVAQDKAKAVALYKQACDKGDTGGCKNLEITYKEACDEGNMGGCDKLAGMYKKGDAVIEDPSKAAVFYEKVCDRGNAWACKELGFLYFNGEGVTEDQIKAVALYKKACDGGYAKGCTYLGMQYFNGLGVTKDKIKTVALYKKACDGGDTWACTKLGSWYNDGKEVAQDYKKAILFYQKACKLKSEEGCKNAEKIIFATANTVSAYQAYLKQYPNGEYASSAKTNIEELNPAKIAQRKREAAAQEYTRKHSCDKLYVGKAVDWTYDNGDVGIGRITFSIQGQITGIGNGVASAKASRDGKIVEKACSDFY